MLLATHEAEHSLESMGRDRHVAELITSQSGFNIVHISATPTISKSKDENPSPLR